MHEKNATDFVKIERYWYDTLLEDRTRLYLLRDLLKVVDIYGVDVRALKILLDDLPNVEVSDDE